MPAASRLVITTPVYAVHNYPCVCTCVAPVGTFNAMPNVDAPKGSKVPHRRRSAEWSGCSVGHRWDRRPSRAARRPAPPLRGRRSPPGPKRAPAGSRPVPRGSNRSRDLVSTNGPSPPPEPRTRMMRDIRPCQPPARRARTGGLVPVRGPTREVRDNASNVSSALLRPGRRRTVGRPSGGVRWQRAWKAGSCGRT
jgi:hypothetical protein